MAKKGTSFSKKIFISILLIVSISVGVGGYYAYQSVFQTKVNLGGKRSKIIYIPTGSTFDDVASILDENGIVEKMTLFRFLAEKRNYIDNIKPGKYRILDNMNNSSLIAFLKAGIQESIPIKFNGIHTKTQLVSRVYRRIEADSLSLALAMKDNVFLKKYGFTSETVQALFIPKTYDFYWNTSVDDFFQRMATEYKLFWTADRKLKAKALKLSQTEVAILATIVQSEQCCDNEEKKIIAGLYLNRLKKGMKLQSDPTVIFALNDFTIQRVTKQHLKMDLPYNTYIYKGLPPGPIGFAYQSSIDAVLNYKKNDYLYMCAKDDLSQRHNFTKSHTQHCINANRYHRALNKRKIY